ncbi:MAG: hypothetical protein NW220_02610 [Leptolyngbyaceae cyanobacterium bins.349]|nr:hypothetical protein [Leptolyngbyaceae cyanobacterium bins.349]
MADFRAYPRLEAFERLHISDGLTITAERWQQAHNYHRQRQNFHYQALYEPGIVYGLGVAPLPDQPDGRLLQIQPGVAIDIQGNPIILKTPEEFRLTSEASDGQPIWVYLVVNYVDPDDLRRAPVAKTVQETFRIVEKLHLDPNDVELCRVQLLPAAIAIQASTDVFAPQPNQLDLRGRPTPQPYRQYVVRVGQINGDRPTDATTYAGLTDLLRSLAGLYPSLGAAPTVQPFSAKALSRETAIDCHLLYLPYNTLLTLPNPGLQRLQSYLATGATVLVAADFGDTNLLNLLDIGQELHRALMEAERDGELEPMTRQLRAEIAANQQAIAQQLEQLEQSLRAIAAAWGLPLHESGDLSLDHPLRSHPFLFSQPPPRQGHPVYIKNWGGLVFLVGDLSLSWGRSAMPPISREVLRSAQEWGINLLHFAAQRQHWVQSMRPLPLAPTPTRDSLQQRVN